MFRKRVATLGLVGTLIGVSILSSVSVTLAQDEQAEDDVKILTKAELEAMPEDTMSCYKSEDGGIHWLPVDASLIDREDAITTDGLYIEEMSPEDEAGIVHDVPPCPVIIDGVLYEPEQIHLFDGQRLGFTVGNDGRLYAFTTVEGMRSFLQE